MKKIISSVITAALLLSSFSTLVFADSSNSETVVSTAVSGYVSGSGGDIEIASANKTPKIYVSADDWAGVIRAAGDLQSDIESVTDVTPLFSDTVTISSADSDESDAATGVTTGANPSLVTGESIENGKGIIAVYNSDGSLCKTAISESYADGTFYFDEEISLSDGQSVKGMVWSNDEQMQPVTGVYGKADNAAANVSVNGADIIIGTIGMSDEIDTLIELGAIDVSDVEGKWEAFTLQEVDGTLVIAGADKRGTIYGIYDLTEKMGVSPWEWWADVTPVHSDAIYVTLPDGGYTEGEPSVKYRGIFINQEYNLNRWSLSLDPDGTEYMNTETYEKIFELLLRLKANYLWPAMHEYSPAFNSNSENAVKADEYGIIMGSSHCEMLLRNNMGELLDFQEQWIADNPDKNLYMFKDSSLGEYVAYDYTDYDADGNYVYNKEFMQDYWRERVRENGGYENVYTIGIRGVHDGTWDPIAADTNAEKIELLEEIISVQRQILSEETGKNADEIPQVFIPYKEIATLYDTGDLDIPDDVIIMRTNDNYGHIRQTFSEEEAARSGGGGIYYHVSYYGRPTSVIWTAGTQLGLIKEEMTKAYDSGADTIWLVNVGPLKGFENQMEYFLDLGRNIEQMRDIKVADYVADNAKRYFGFDDEDAAEYAAIQCEYLEAANARRLDAQVEGVYSLTAYGDEGTRMLNKYKELESRSEALYEKLDEDRQYGFYELQLYAARTAVDVMNNYIGADRSILAANQGRLASVNKYIAQSESGNKTAVQAETDIYNTMLDGKWNKVMNPFQTKLYISQTTKIANATAADTVTELGFTQMGIAVENQEDITENPELEFSGYTKDVRFIDIFNEGTGSFDWTAAANVDWIEFNKASGTVYDDDRIYAAVDWASVPVGVSTAEITITEYLYDTAVSEKTINVTVNNNTVVLDEKTYAEANGYVSIEAEHYSASVSNGGYEWTEQDDFGRSGTSMKFEGSGTGISDNSAYLEYNVYFESAGTFSIDVYRMPTLNEGGSVNFAVGIDDGASVTLKGTKAYTGSQTGSWAEGILNNNETLTADITVSEAGLHTIRLYGIDTGAVVDKMVITTGTKYDSFYGAPESYNTTYNSDAGVMPDAEDAAEEITGDITALFEPSLYTLSYSASEDTIESVDILKIADNAAGAKVTAAAYDSGGIMLSSATSDADFSDKSAGDTATVTLDFTVPANAAEIQIIVYDSSENLNALSPVYTVNTESLSLSAVYDAGGTVTLKTSLDEYAGMEAICMITPEGGDEPAYIRQETVSDGTFKTINTGTLDGTYDVRVGVSGEGVVAEEKAYTAVNIETDTEENTVTLYEWDFSDEEQTASSGTNIPVLSGNAVYDSDNEAVKMTSTDSSGGKASITFDEPVSVVQGQTITVVSQIAYGRQSGKYMDYTISDSDGNALVYSHICAYTTSSGGISIGGASVCEGSPDGVVTSNKNNSGIDNGYSTYTAVLNPDANTITLTISNSDGESTFTGKFPSGSSYDLGSISFSTTQTYTSRSCFVDNISVSKTTDAAYTIGFDVTDTDGKPIDGAEISVTDSVYGTEIAANDDGTYTLCSGTYSYIVTADGYSTVSEEIDLNPSTESKTIAVKMTKSGESTANTASITIKYVDEENNELKDAATLTEQYEDGDIFSVPDTLKTAFAVKNSDGMYDYYEINETASELSAEYAEEMTLTLVFNAAVQYDYYEDFESYTLDTSSWHVQSSSVPDPTLETDNTTYLKHETGSSTTGGYMTFEAVDTTEKTVHITADVKFTAATGAQSSGSIGNSQFAISNETPSFSSNNITYGIKSDSSGHIIVFEYNAGETLTVNGNSLSLDFIGNWIHLEADVNFSDKSASIEVTDDAGHSASFDDTTIFSSSFDDNIGSIYLRSAGVSGTVSTDNITVRITGDAGAKVPDVESVINYKSVYAFGDSIVYGHNTPSKSFMKLIADDYAMDLTMMAKNGATVMSSDNQIITQVNNASDEAPDFIVFDGYTNDAYGSSDSDTFNSSGTHTDVTTCYGEISAEGTTEFDTDTFCGSFENLIYTMKQKYPDTPIVFVTIHKSGARDMTIQQALHDYTVAICEKWDVYVVDMFEDSDLDTTDAEQMAAYIINGSGSHPNETACRTFYMPMVVSMLESIVNGTADDDAEATAEPTSTPAADDETDDEESEYSNTAGIWLFDFGENTADGYIGVNADTNYTDSLNYGFIGTKADDYKLTSGEYMDAFRIVKGQSIELADGSGSGEAPNDDFVAVTDSQYPIRFTMSVENGGYYNVKVTLANASDTEPAIVSLFAERRHQLLTNEEIPAGGTLEYEFSVDVETYYWKALNGQYKDDTLSIEVVGENAAIASMEVTKAETNGTTLWILSDSTGCDQPTNFPYFNLASLAGVGQGLTKYLSSDIAMSNQGDGGIASSDSSHWSCVKSAFKEGDYLYIEYGHNESSTSSYTSNLEKYYTACHEAGVKMIVVGPIDRCQTKQFDAETGTWSSTLSGYSDAGKAFVEQKIEDGAQDIAFVDLNAGWIEFLNETAAQVKTARSSDTYEANSAYYYYRYKTGGIDTTHINEAGADNAAYIFFTEAKKIIDDDADSVQAQVLSGLVENMRDNTPYTVTDEIIQAGTVPNSYYPTIPAEEYDGYEAEIRGVAFDDNILTSVTAKVNYYTGFEAKGVPYAVAVAELYDSEGELSGTYTSTADSKYDATNGSGTFTFVFDDENAVLPEDGTYTVWIQGFSEDNTLMEGEDYRFSEYFTQDSDIYLVGDYDDITVPDTFSYYGVKTGADLSGNNSWYLVGSSTKSATLEADDDGGYAQLTKSSTSGSYVVYRAFDSAVSSGKIVLDTDVYYESGYMKLILSCKDSTPNGGYDNNEYITAFTIDNGVLLDGNGSTLSDSFPTGEWTHITYTLDMDYGTQELTVDNGTTYEYTAVGMDSVIPDNVTVASIQQINIAGNSSNTLSARIRNTSVKNVSSGTLPAYTLTLNNVSDGEGSVSIDGTDELYLSAKMNSSITVSAEAADGYVFSGWYEGETLVSSSETVAIRLHRDITLTAKFEERTDGAVIWNFSEYADSNAVTATAATEEQYTKESEALNIYLASGDSITSGGLVWSKPTTTASTSTVSNRYIEYTPTQDGTLTVVFQGNTYKDSSHCPRMYIASGVTAGESTKATVQDSSTRAYVDASAANTATTVTYNVSAGTKYHIFSYYYGGTSVQFTISKITFTPSAE